MSTTIFNFLLIAGVIQGFVFNAVTLLYKKKPSKVIIFLNLIVVFISLNNLQAWLIESGFSSKIFFIKQFLVPWYMLLFPMLYMFIVHYLKIKSYLNYILKLFVFLFILELIIRASLIIYVYNFVENLDNSLINNYTQIEEILNAILGFFILFKVSILVFKEVDKYKFIQKYDNIKWLKTLLIIGGFVFSFWIFAIIINNYLNTNTAYLPLRLGTSILLYWIAYQGFFRYYITEDRIMLRGIIKDNKNYLINEKTNASKKVITNNSTNNFNDFKKINQYIVSNQKFLETNISMEHLANELQMSTSHFSKIINTCNGTNFSDYISYYRVEQAKKLLQDSKFNNYTIAAIALECGFSSKSTFYAAFKKFTNKTPSQYKADL